MILDLDVCTSNCKKDS